MAAMEILFKIIKDDPNNIIDLEQSIAILAAMEVVFKLTRDGPNNIIYLDQ